MSVEIWPVIHLSDKPMITLENARVAQRCDCPGVFLISMSGEDKIVDPAARLIRHNVPELKIGINMLTMSPIESVHHSLTQGYDATWSDYSWQEDADSIAWGIQRAHIISRFKPQAFNLHKFFAAVAMKGETHDEPCPERSLFMAKDHGFIPMTSGSGTGVTAPFDKIRNFSYALGSGSPLAMSGVHPPLAHNLVPYTTHWLVATAISDDFYHFNENKLRYLVSQSQKGLNNVS